MKSYLHLIWHNPSMPKYPSECIGLETRLGWRTHRTFLRNPNLKEITLMHNTHLVGLRFMFLVSLLPLKMSKTFYSCHDEHLPAGYIMGYLFQLVPYQLVPHFYQLVPYFYQLVPLYHINSFSMYYDQLVPFLLIV